ncbi:MAG: YARHG domain-containing protein [Firmicutes bacterium]|nr:YARHG domain-containing protein [Bacillota bacterium]
MQKTGNLFLILIALLLALGLSLCVFLEVNFRNQTKLPALSPADVSAADTVPDPSSQDPVRISLEDTVMTNTPLKDANEKREAQGKAAEEALRSEGFLCVFSDSLLITQADLDAIFQNPPDDLPEGYSVAEMILYEMYARRGFTFRDTSLREYFEDKAWYQAAPGKTDNRNVVLARMNDIERQNLAFLESLQNEIGEE